MRRIPIVLVSVCLSLCLSGCFVLDWFDSDDPRKPLPLTEITPKVVVTQLWKFGIGNAGRYFFAPALVGDDIIVADFDGDVVRLNSTTGAQVWKISLDEKLSSGVGADAGTFAVATLKGEVVAFDLDGKQRWRGNVGGEMLSSPGVGDGIVVGRTTDGRFVAFDSGTGAKRWTYARQAQPLVLRTAPGMVLSAGQLYAGLSGGRLIAVTDLNGGLRWDTAVTIPKGTTELERVADVMGKPVLANREICVASFQGRAGCFDITSGNSIWTHEVSTTNGIGIDARGAYVSDEKSIVQALSRSGGASIWKNDKLQFRSLTTPTPFDNFVVVGDYQGFLHFLSEDDGAIVGRIATDGSRIVSAPLVIDTIGAPSRLIVQTTDGGIFAFTAQ